MRATIYTVSGTTTDGPHSRCAFPTLEKARACRAEMRRAVEDGGRDKNDDQTERRAWDEPITIERVTLSGRSREVAACLATLLLDTDSSIEIHGWTDSDTQAAVTVERESID